MFRLYLYIFKDISEIGDKEMRKSTYIIILLFFITSVSVNAQWRHATHDKYNALQADTDIKIDGNLDDWDGVLDAVKGTDGKPFCGIKNEQGVFEAHGGGNWKGPDDHETCFMILWTPEYVYLALDVTDDEHEHAAGAAWNGDGAQLAFEPTGKRQPARTDILYNAGLSDDAKNLLLQNETTRGNPGLVGGEDVVIVRDEVKKKTYYEFRISPDNLGYKDPFKEGLQFGLGICVNDGDKAAGQGGQKGWSGWYPHSIVHGKNPDKTGLVILTDETLAVDPINKITTTWGNIKSLK